MVYLTKLNGTPFVLNADLIELIESNPDTTIRMTDKNYFIVRESIDEVVNRVIDFKRKCSDVCSRLHLADEEAMG
ncbi:MAG: flagellar FlbD family protein [Oscillospiraceae bacterium]|nr:flagellar FlbD family protein [Oscillospiraceae bacterium]